MLMSITVERFFRSYAEAFNRSPGDRAADEGIRSQFTQCFVAARPNDVQCGKKSDTFEIFAFVAGDGMALFLKHELVPGSASRCVE